MSKDYLKEKITREIMVAEWKRRAWSQAAFILILPPFSVFGLAILLPLCFPFEEADTIVVLSSIFLAGMLIVSLIWFGVSAYRIVHNARHCTVVSDTLIGVGMDRHVDRHYAGTNHQYHYFRFEEHGLFYVGEDTRYTLIDTTDRYAFSKMNRMNTKDLLRRAATDDEYYLLIAGTRILDVYSKNSFELVGEEQ